MKLRRKSVILRKYINFCISFWKKLRHREQIPWPPVMAVVTNLMYAFSIIITSNMIFCKGKYYWTIDNLLPPGNKRRASFCLGSSLCSRYHRQHHHLEVIITIIGAIPIWKLVYLCNGFIHGSQSAAISVYLCGINHPDLQPSKPTTTIIVDFQSCIIFQFVICNLHLRLASFTSRTGIHVKRTLFDNTNI